MMGTSKKTRNASLILLLMMIVLLGPLGLCGSEQHWCSEGDFEGRTFPVAEPFRVNLEVLPDSGELEQITVSAWIRPEKYEAFNEIFRQESGEERILFSLQDSATILSLGLNIDGYLECDAPLRRDALFDGDWHFAVGTFDGEMMKVYLDGTEIHRLPRTGQIKVQKEIPGYIGCCNGVNEFFFGDLFDVAISSVALTPDQVKQQYQNGLVILDRQNSEMNALLNRYYRRESTFVETLIATRNAMLENRARVTSGLKLGLTRRLKVDFPNEFEEFVDLTGLVPCELISRTGFKSLQDKSSRLVHLMSEYKPLTPEQWSGIGPEERENWFLVDQLQRRFEDLTFGTDAETVNTLLEILRTAKTTVQERPQVREAVAPYRIPQTPDPKTYNPKEADELLTNDWLFQCDFQPSWERIIQEIGWSKELANRFLLDDRVDKAFMQSAIAKLDRVGAQSGDATGPQNSTVSSRDELLNELYLQVRRIKREIFLRNPVLDFSQILFVDMPYPDGSEWRHETRHRLGYMAVPGGQLLVLDGLSPNGTVRRVLPQEPLHGSFWRPDVSFDGTKALVSFKPHNEKAFHIYEVHLDGTGFRQITAGMFDDFDPIYLPDQKNFVFSTSRGYTYVRCMPPTNAFVLARCTLQGDQVYLISQNNEPDYLPSVLNDGRLIYTRWEYTDKPLWRCQSLWTTNPDGTQHNTFWGNQTVWPDLLKDARAIPGSNRVMFTGSAHHDWFAGSIGIINPEEGRNFPDGLTKVTADMAWPESGNGPVDPVESPNYHASGSLTAYYSPYPLSEKDFLVSACKNGKFMLYLMDVEGNRELVYEGVNNIFHAIPIRKRPVPPVLVDRVDWPDWKERSDPKPGTIYSGNVYHGAPPELQGKAKFLRILHIEPKTYTLWDNRPYISTGPVVSMVQSEGVKRILGTVPIEEDGSVWFEVPAGIALHFQLLDENHFALQTMRSFTGVMPGESRGCLGCHELHTSTPLNSDQGQYAALNKSPRKIRPVPWSFDPDYSVPSDWTVEQSQQKATNDFAIPLGRLDPYAHLRADIRRNGTAISYVKDIKPILHQYCGNCHEQDGEGRATFDLTPRPGFLMFEEPYVTIIGAPNWGAPGVFPTGAWGGGTNRSNAELPPGFGIAGTLHVEAYDQRDPDAYSTPRPLGSLSYKSPLVHIARSGEHNEVKMDPISLHKLILWVDAMCPYIDDTAIRSQADPVFQGSNWLSIPPRLQTAPKVVRPGPFHARFDDSSQYQCTE